MKWNMSALGVVLATLSSGAMAETAPLPAQNLEEQLKVKTDLHGNNIPDTNINDESNFIGDRISFPLITPIADINGTSNCSIPPGVTMKALGLNANQDLVLYTPNEQIECYRQPPVSGNPTYIPAYRKLLVAKDDRVGMHRFGLTYGGLIVPYKYLTGAKEFRGGTSIAPYVGYRFDPSSYGYGVKLIGFFGATTVDVEGNNSSSLGVTYGVGLLGQIKGDFQLGVVFGADQVGESENYQFNKKPWIALSIGYDFSS